MIKEKVRECIENYQLAVIANLEQAFNDKKEASDIEENDVRDADSHSHQSQSQADEELVNNLIKRAKIDLEHLKRIPKIKSTRVEEGALIETKNLFIYVGIITQKFTEDGKDIIGISTSAPIYETLKNQTVGFPFQIIGIDCEIISIN